MLGEKTGIGHGLLFTLTISLILGTGNQQLPYLAAKYGNSNGYLGLIGAYLLIVLVIIAAVDLQKKYPRKSIVEYTPLVLGNLLGKLIGFIFICFILVLLAWSIRTTAEAMNLYFLQRTPLWAIMALFFLAVTYLALHGIEGIAKTGAFFLPLALIVLFFTLIASYQHFDFDRIKPVFYLHQGIVVSVMHLFTAFFSIATLFMILPYLTDHRKSLSVILKATGLSAGILFFYIVADIGTFGVKGVIRYGWPTTELPRTINIPYLIKNFGLLYTVTWLSLMYIGAGTCYFAAAQGCTQLFSRLHYKWTILLLWPVICLLAWIAPGVIEVRQFFDYFRIAGLIILFSLPLFIWAADRLKNPRRKVNDA